MVQWQLCAWDQGLYPCTASARHLLQSALQDCTLSLHWVQVSLWEPKMLTVSSKPLGFLQWLTQPRPLPSVHLTLRHQSHLLRTEIESMRVGEHRQGAAVCPGKARMVSVLETCSNAVPCFQNLKTKNRTKEGSWHELVVSSLPSTVTFRMTASSQHRSAADLRAGGG